MENIILIACIISAVYCFFKFVEMKWFEKPKDMKPLKYFVRDVILVFLSALIGTFIYFNIYGSVSEFVHTITDAKVMVSGPAPVFTDAPGF
jgi:hypothetical protein